MYRRDRTAEAQSRNRAAATPHRNPLFGASVCPVRVDVSSIARVRASVFVRERVL